MTSLPVPRRRAAHLRGDTAPEVGVRPLRVKHGRHHRLVLGDQQVEGVGVGEDVVGVGVLRRRGGGEETQRLRSKEATSKAHQRGVGGYQDVVGPALPGEAERRLLQLHHVLVSAVGPVFGAQLPRVPPATGQTSQRWTRHGRLSWSPGRAPVACGLTWAGPSASTPRGGRTAARR